MSVVLIIIILIVMMMKMHGDDINDENEIHIIMFFSVFFCMISNS